jgi:hypothetical protein
VRLVAVDVKDVVTPLLEKEDLETDEEMVEEVFLLDLGTLNCFDQIGFKSLYATGGLPVPGIWANVKPTEGSR